MAVAIKDGSWPVSRLYWAGHQVREYGGYLGYATLVKSLAKCVEHAGDSPLALRVQDPDNWAPVAGKRNLAYTMWESRDFPLAYIPNLRQAEALLVPSTFCQEVFRGVADCAVYRIPPAVDTDVFTYVKRRLPKPGERFRWLWLNAPDVRKGYVQICKMWERKEFAANRDMELYLKTTAASGNKVQYVGQNVIFDSRVLSLDELVRLYHSAHGFLYLSAGEGFGYTLAEAMSTGLPCVGIEHSGVTDFFSRGTGFVSPHTIHRVGRSVDEGGKMSNASDGLYEVAMPDMRGFAAQMSRVVEDYKGAVEIARRGARLIRERFTMQGMAAALHEVVLEHQ